MESGNLNCVGSISAAGSARMQIGNNTTNNFYQDDDKKCLAALCSTDPRHDKNRIEQTNGGLLKESYLWILHNPEFHRWCDPKENCPLLWIRGDPGKGKTMLLSGIINELQHFTRLGNSGTDTSLSYFFCQATNSGLNNATAVLRGLAYLLVEQQPCLLSHVRDKASLNPEHWNSGVAIKGILSEMLRDPAVQNVIFVVDALDECITDLEFLLNFISSTTSTQVRWIVSSRNISDIEQHLKQAQTKVALSLELNAESVSQAVDSYIHHQVHQLGAKKQFSTESLRFVETYLCQNANGTFLWVSLVCQRLSQSKRWEVEKFLKDFPPGLNKLYERMMETISDKSSEDLYRRILAIISTVHRPITFSELMAIEDLSFDEDIVPEMVMECGCFLTFRDKTIYFVHQSAKDFLAKKQDILFPFGLARHHLGLFDKSLKGLEKLKMDIYGQVYPAISVDDILDNLPEHDPLSGLAYFCQFWAHHLRHSQAICVEDPLQYNKVHQFMADKFLFWLEALSLLRSLPAAMKTLQILEDLPLNGETIALVEDARLFFLFFQPAIKDHPLQTYASGLLFSPEESLTRRHFEHCSPKFVVKKPQVNAQWSPYMTVPEFGCETTFSTDSKSLVTVSNSEMAIWKVSDGMESMRTNLEDLGHITPSPDLEWFACVTFGGQPGHEVQTAIQVRSLESNSVKWSRTLDNHQVERMKFSPDSQWLVMCFNQDLLLWGVEKNDFKRWPLEVSLPHLWGIEFSSDSALVAFFGNSHKGSGCIVVVDVCTGEHRGNPKAAIKDVSSAVFLPNIYQIMMCSWGDVWSWNITGEECEQWLRFDGYARHIASSHHSSWIAVATDSTVFLYRRQSKELLQKFEIPSVSDIYSIATSFNDERLAVDYEDDPVYLLDIPSSMSKQNRCEGVAVKKVFVSDNGGLMAWALEMKIQVLDATTGSHLFESNMPWCWNSKSLEPWSTDNLAAFSSQGHLLATSASASSFPPPRSPSLLFVWDLASKRLLHKIEVPSPTHSLAVYRDEDNREQWVAAITKTNIYVWDAMTMEQNWSLEHSAVKDEFPSRLHFSDGKLAVLWYLADSPHLIYYDITNGAELSCLQLSRPLAFEPYFGGFSVSPNGQRAARGIDGFPLRIIFISQEEGGIRRASLVMDTTYQSRLSFLNNSTVLTDRGVFDIDTILTETTIEPNALVKPEKAIPTVYPDFFGYGCSDYRNWITLDGCRFLWLPPQYRPISRDTQFAAGEHHFAMHSFSGVFFIRFSQDARDLLRGARCEPGLWEE